MQFPGTYLGTRAFWNFRFTPTPLSRGGVPGGERRSSRRHPPVSHHKECIVEMLRISVRRRTLLLDRRDFVFITDEGVEVLKTHTCGVPENLFRFGWSSRA